MQRRELIAGAAGTLLFSFLPADFARGAQMVAVRMWPAQEYTRVTLEHDGPLKFKYFFVRSSRPLRLVVDIEGLDNASAELPAQKMILCTNQAPSEVGVIYNKVEREEDSLSSNSFCIHAIDTREKKIYITFFGAYKPSNDSDYPDIHTLSYR